MRNGFLYACSGLLNLLPVMAIPLKQILRYEVALREKPSSWGCIFLLRGLLHPP
ncbi:MAG: hypothetical protein KF862_26035 [Chitinophagaceae bacterium]|nr:hypothetical protein [Chitinophagaceae bacterium]